MVDENNTRGLGNVENPSLVAIFTYHNAERAKTEAIDYPAQGVFASQQSFT